MRKLVANGQVSWAEYPHIYRPISQKMINALGYPKESVLPEISGVPDRYYLKGLSSVKECQLYVFKKGGRTRLNLDEVRVVTLLHVPSKQFIFIEMFGSEHANKHYKKMIETAYKLMETNGDFCKVKGGYVLSRRHQIELELCPPFSKAPPILKTKSGSVTSCSKKGGAKSKKNKTGGSGSWSASLYLPREKVLIEEELRPSSVFFEKYTALNGLMRKVRSTPNWEDVCDAAKLVRYLSNNNRQENLDELGCLSQYQVNIILADNANTLLRYFESQAFGYNDLPKLKQALPLMSALRSVRDIESIHSEFVLSLDELELLDKFQIHIANQIHTIEGKSQALRFFYATAFLESRVQHLFSKRPPNNTTGQELFQSIQLMKVVSYAKLAENSKLVLDKCVYFEKAFELNSQLGSCLETTTNIKRLAEKMIPIYLEVLTLYTDKKGHSAAIDESVKKLLDMVCVVANSRVSGPGINQLVEEFRSATHLFSERVISRLSSQLFDLLRKKSSVLQAVLVELFILTVNKFWSISNDESKARGRILTQCKLVMAMGSQGLKKCIRPIYVRLLSQQYILRQNKRQVFEALTYLNDLFQACDEDAPEDFDQLKPLLWACKDGIKLAYLKKFYHNSLEKGMRQLVQEIETMYDGFEKLSEPQLADLLTKIVMLGRQVNWSIQLANKSGEKNGATFKEFKRNTRFFRGAYQLRNTCVIKFKL